MQSLVSPIWAISGKEHVHDARSDDIDDRNLLSADRVEREALHPQLDRDEEIRELGVHETEHDGRTERDDESELLPEQRAIDAPRENPRGCIREDEKTLDELHDDHRPDDGHDVAAEVGGDEKRRRPNDDSPRTNSRGR